jgi:hypothetical protein
MNKKDRTQRSLAIKRFLMDPERKDIAVTAWLLLNAIQILKKTDIETIQNKIRSLWSKIHKHDPKFFLTFPKSNDGHKLIRITTKQQVYMFVEMGLVGGGYLEGSSEIPYFIITQRGKDALEEGYPEVRRYLKSVHYFEKDSRK